MVIFGHGINIMSNRDGKGAKTRDIFATLKEGNHCPHCAKSTTRKNRKLKLDEDGHALPIRAPYGGSLRECECGCNAGRTRYRNVYCTKCGFSTF